MSGPDWTAGSKHEVVLHQYRAVVLEPRLPVLLPPFYLGAGFRGAGLLDLSPSSAPRVCFVLFFLLSCQNRQGKMFNSSTYNAVLSSVSPLHRGYSVTSATG